MEYSMLKVLLIEDNPGDARLIKEAIREIPNLNIELSHANCLQAGLSKLSENHFDFVLLDLGLPDSLGLGTLIQVRDRFHSIPVVVLTGLDDEMVAVHAVQAGAQDYLVKGQIDSNILRRAIKYAIERQRLLTDLFEKMEAIKEAEKKINTLYSGLLQDLKTASEIQSYLIPNEIIIHNEIIFCSKYTPSSKVGGDLYDVIPVSDGRYFMYMGDISGHGVQAALLMTAVRTILSMLIETEHKTMKLHQMATRLNNILTGELFQNNYMTLLLGYVDLRENVFNYINAGHPPVITYNMQERKATIQSNAGSIPLGWKKDILYTPEDETMGPLDKDTLYMFYTDGLFECENPDQCQMGLEGLTQVLEKQLIIDGCLLLPHKIKTYMIKNQYEIGSDDFALLTFQVNPAFTKDTAYEPEIQPDKYRYYVVPYNPDNTKAVQKKQSYDQNIIKVGAVGNQCEATARNWGFSQDYAARLELVVNEYLNNILVHGLKESGQSEIIIELHCHDEIEVRFIDHGKEWNPSITPTDNVMITYPGKVADLPESGWGMKIIQSQISFFSKKNDTIIITKLFSESESNWNKNEPL